MKDSSFCPYRQHKGLILECNYKDCICKRDHCPYFPTLEQAKSAYQRRLQETGEIVVAVIAKMKRKIKDAQRERQKKERMNIKTKTE